MVILNLNDKYYYGADCGNDIGDYQRDVSPQEAVYDKEDASQPKHYKGGHGNTVSISGTNGHHRLRQVAENHTQTGQVAEYFSDYLSGHGIRYQL